MNQTSSVEGGRGREGGEGVEQVCCGRAGAHDLIW